MSQKFVNSIKNHAINAAKNSGMLASVLAAQACLETGYGTSDLARKANNLFGIKGTYNGQSYTKKTAEQKTNGQVYYVNAAFRKYPSFTESFQDRIAFFTSTTWRTQIYKPVTDAKLKGYKAQVKALHESPYATDTQYDKKLLNIIEQYKLYEWDDVNVTKRHLIVAGHGGSDPGALGNGTNERDFTRAYYVDQIAKYINDTPGHEAVVYDKRQNMYLDTYNGGGMYWAEKQGFDTVTEIHQDAATAAATGGHIIVYSGFVPDAIDLAMRDSIHKYVGTRYTHKGHYGISGRDNLLQVNVAAQLGVNYRLVELGFITNSTDFRNFKNNNEAIAKDFAQAITGKASSKQSTSKPVANTQKDKQPGGKTIEQLAKEVIAGKHGTGAARQRSLGIQYNAVQRRVNAILSGSNTVPKKKSVDTVAREVIAGKWGNGNARFNALKKAGYDANAVQRRVNQLL